MEIRQLKYFVAVVDAGSLSRAAREVHVAQSALSKQMSALEADLGAQLFHRSNSGIRVNDAGKLFYEYAQGLLKHLQDARAAISSEPGALSGSIVVALPQSVASTVALPLIQAVARTYPKVELHLNEELTGNLVDQLVRGRVDIALFTPIGLPPQVSFSPLLEEDFYLIHRADDRHAPPPGSVTLAEAVARPLVFPSRAHSHSTRACVDQALERLHLPPAQVAMEVNSVHILKSAVEAGIGPSIMPLNLALREVAEGRLVAHAIQPREVFRTLGICVCEALPGSNLRSAIANLIAQVVRDMSRSGEWPATRLLPEA
ncbi:transcriptional regulator, LysR family [Pseudomonas sp. NFPP10]|uniref:LysR family transcriptional regulator n=1 Tax=unclassified Pseudomonas TaxID=196821 RepID=UPI0008895E26|nr:MULTISPECIES: LysR substrate-binding domain-containing protein [unclassified Pseudomonas]SDA34191.1 transcriptional regulator, LysR family [Pseudomonas sp. NFPP12]SEM75230.1 transcriptional regulator, LysR family [Pseudomonas sp. NFPP10]SFK35343.1 transcriptional regulator, LysR family [Pseudomonas sp. NFPP08]SFN70540.1 transcriptional regulator, LysR family [Pseudomonas sp. NFPP05]SFY08112.1 transcriptional regulator, LysR family [Pseudomonas sp. NFPP09]